MNWRRAVGLLGVLCFIAGGPQLSVAQGGTSLFWMDSTSVIEDAQAVITVSASSGTRAGGFNLLFTFNTVALDFLAIEPLGAVADWEYFNYQLLAPGDCGPDCHTVAVRLTGIADLPDGEDPGDIFSIEGEIAQIHIQTTSECRHEGECFLLQWTWYECTDNSMTSITGDTLFLASAIETILPGEDCLGLMQSSAFEANLDFVNGLVCKISPNACARGDINLNGISWEIGDAVLYSDYFIYGPQAFGYPDDPYYQNRVLASDINDDGTPLTFADLVLLVRLISGDARPRGD